jgi:predicted ribosome quality control (RQC) complex YloA/Tae2 family protein
MDQKRDLTSVDLVALVPELGGYAGATVDKAYRYEDDLVRLKMRDYDRGRVELLLQVGDPKRAHVARPEHVADAPGRPPNFAKMLRNRIAGADLAAVRQHGFDRILELEFRRADQDTTLVAELFGEGNVAVIDQNGEVVDCLETVRLRSRTVAPGARYEFPAARATPWEMDFEAFAAEMRDSDTDVVRTLATQLDFGGLWAEELCTRAGVEKALDVGAADDEDLREVYGAIQPLFESLDDPDPRVYLSEGRRVDVAPVPMEEYADLEAEPFDSFNAALDDYFTNLGAEEDADGESAEGGSGGGGRERPDFESEIATQERIIEQQEGAIEDFEAQAETEREKAEQLYADYDLADAVLSTVREAREAGHAWEDIESRFAEGAQQGIEAAEAVAGVDPEAGTVTVELDGHGVELDPAEGVEQNADRLYREAKRIEEKKAGAEEAIAETRAELERVKERRDQWAADPEEAPGENGDGGGDEEKAAAETDWRSLASVPIRQPEHWYERFRWFRTGEDFLVLGGRDADQNEELVEKYMDRYDRFLHTQAHGGPATVLKTSEPSEPSEEIEVPDASLEQAAQFAVTYSSIWKDGRGAGDVYLVSPEQVSKTPESGEFLEKGGFAVRGDRTYFRDQPVSCAVGILCEPETRVVGGPPAAIEPRTEVSARVEPGRYAQGDVAKRLYRQFREAFTDESFVRKVASPDRIQHFLPPGGSRILD